MPNLRHLIALLLLVVILVATGVLANLRSDELIRTDRIAYVDDNGVIHTIREDGSGPITISPDVAGFFTWPTWGPDSGRLVYSGVTGSRDSIKMSLYASRASGANAIEIFAGEPGVTGQLALGVIHYPLWSPNGEHVAFIAATGDGLTLFMDDISVDPNATKLLDHGPLWISWAPDSQHLLAHRADEHFLIGTGANKFVAPIGLADVESRVPAWSPDGMSFITALRAGRSQYHILRSAFLGGKNQAAQRLLTTIPIPTYLWSPDGIHLSVANSSRALSYSGLTLDLYGDISIYADTASSPVHRITEPTLAHFWSPDGKKIAYVKLSDTPRVLRWAVLDIESGVKTELVDFLASEAQLTMFQFFDQYTYSHSLWSPESDALVFAGNLSTDAVTASFRSSELAEGNVGNRLAHDGDHIIVVSIADEVTSKVIADGFMATWSPN